MPRYIVIDEIILGYYFNGSQIVQVLASLEKCRMNTDNQAPLPDDSRYRPATREDFARFRVSPIGHI